jgi:para-aminobenzoate synthetase
MVRKVRHEGRDVFNGVEDGVKVVLYHSLCVEIPQGEEKLEELAWVEEDGDRILMAVRHKDKPLWGVQYHPESVCTAAEGERVILNWFEQAMSWNEKHGRVVNDGEKLLAQPSMRASLLSGQRGGVMVVGEDSALKTEFLYMTIPIPEGTDVVDIMELLDEGDEEVILLDSSNANLPAPEDDKADVRGRYSVLALGQRESVHVKHHAERDYVELWTPSLGGRTCAERIPLAGYGNTVWGFLADFQNRRRVQAPEGLETPFVGGFLGFVTYEQGLEDIDVEIPTRGHERPDVCLVWVTKSVVIDHRKGVIHIQHLFNERDCLGTKWIERTVQALQQPHSHWKPRDKALDAVSGKPEGVDDKTYADQATNEWKLPDQDDYQAKVELCQEYIAAGDSYELCLTDQTRIPRKRTKSMKRQVRDNYSDSETMEVPTSWQLFKRIRARQPAPFASYLKLGGVTLVSASPERFLEYDQNGRCSMRPMKGTVRKSDTVSTLEQAEKILHVPKEEAENLMIVDLVRHDLHGVCGAGNVQVRDLMKVEEYRDVYQMITVVEGQLPPPHDTTTEERYTGLDVLAASLPPGSMTGAPKKRSCEILHKIEGGQERSLYSGVVGYMCASGRGDWSVTIRSLFRWDDESRNGTETWRIGAGGAVTALSTPLGEAEEMFTKLNGPFRTVNWDRLGWNGNAWE